MKKDVIEIAKRVFDIEAQSILSLKDRLGAHFIEVVECICNCKGKLVLTGIGKSGQIARKISSTFSSTGTPALFLHPAESSHGDLGVIQSDDLVIALSYGGETPELNPLLSYVVRKNISLIAMTGNRDSDLARRARWVLDVKVAKEACPLGLAPTSSSTATLAMGDALAMAVLQSKGFTAEEFSQYHPGGGLGMKLTRIRDLMHKEGQIPLLGLDAPMREILSVMTHGDVRGSAGVVDEQGNLIGIITDGDIRRFLQQHQDPLHGTAQELMTRAPRTIDVEEIAERALFMMEQFRIQLLFVLDKSSQSPLKPVGVLHFQDLIHSKVKV